MKYVWALVAYGRSGCRSHLQNTDCCNLPCRQYQRDTMTLHGLYYIQWKNNMLPPTHTSLDGVSATITALPVVGRDQNLLWIKLCLPTFLSPNPGDCSPAPGNSPVPPRNAPIFGRNLHKPRPFCRPICGRVGKYELNVLLKCMPGLFSLLCPFYTTEISRVIARLALV